MVIMQAPAPSEGGGIAGEHRRRVPPLWRSGVGPPYARGGSRATLANLIDAARAASPDTEQAALAGDARKAAREAEGGRTGPADRGGRRRVRSSRLLPGW